MYLDKLYCGSPVCKEIISDNFVHYSKELKKVFHYERGCAFDAAANFVGNHSFDIRQRQEFVVEDSDDEELRFD